MGTLKGIYAIWWREMITFLRETPRLVGTLTSPILWLFLFGGGLSAAVNIAGIDYQKFIFPGILLQTFLFSSIFYGSYLIWDKKMDMLKAILVSPLSRTSIFLGKVVGGVTISLLEAIIILVVGLFLGIHYTLYSFLFTLGIVMFAAAALTAVGLTVGSFMESPEGFQLIINFLIFPLFFLSGALFPLDNLPGWLNVLTMVDPATYMVDLLRGALIGIQHFGTFENAIILGGFAVAANLVGIWAFNRMKA